MVTTAILKESKTFKLLKMSVISPRTKKEQELIILLKKKDECSYEYIYDTYAPALYAIILQIINDKELAGMALEKAFVAIWENIELYDQSKERLFTWMLRVTRYTALQISRTEPCPTQHKCRNKHCLKKLTMESDPETINFWTNVKGLNEDQKRVLHLAYFKGYSDEEISQIEKIPTSGVTMMIRGALRQLTFGGV